jgi:hypothetical protein
MIILPQGDRRGNAKTPRGGKTLDGSEIYLKNG